MQLITQTLYSQIEELKKNHDKNTYIFVDFGKSKENVNRTLEAIDYLKSLGLSLTLIRTQEYLIRLEN